MKESMMDARLEWEKNKDLEFIKELGEERFKILYNICNTCDMYNIENVPCQWYNHTFQRCGRKESK